MHTPTLELDLKHVAHGRSKYEVLREHFVSQIETGRLKPDEALPTVQALTESLGVAPSTVRQAMGALERDGLICRVQGKGTFVHKEAMQRLHLGSELFALVVPETRLGFFPSLLHGFEAASRECQHQAVVCNTENSVDKQGSAILQLIDRQVSGVAIVPATQSPTPAYQIRQLQQHQIPVVFCHRHVEGVQAPLLALPYEDIGYLAGKKLVEQGHRRVAFVTSSYDQSTERYRHGFQAALHEAGGSADENAKAWYLDSSSSDRLENDVSRSVETMMSQRNTPTAIFATFDSLAEQVYLQLVSRGIRVPEEVSLVGVGGTWREGAVVRRLSSVVVDEVAAAFRAVKLMVEIRKGIRPASDGQQFALPLDVSDGQTLGPVPVDVQRHIQSDEETRK